MKFIERYRVKPHARVNLGQWDPDETPGVDGKKEAKALVKAHRKRLRDLQEVLYAEGRRSLLIVLQAMDAGGKDGTIRHVMRPLNPQGCRVASFKVPTEEERAHDFLWRIHRAAPRTGEIGIFNRSHYEDVLVVRVHDLVPETVWSTRYKAINAFERLLADAGTTILKFYLHISPEEQLERFRKRVENPRKHWKVSSGDFQERKHWDAYMAAFEDALAKCSTAHAPWFIIPANRKWFRNLAVSEILLETMEGMKLEYPKGTFDPAELDWS